MDLKELYRSHPGGSKIIRLYFAVFCFFTLIVFLCQNFLPQSDFLGGMFIPDVVNMSDTFDNLRTGDLLNIILSGLSGVYFLYYIPWITHPALCIVLNLILIYYSLKMLYELFVLTNISNSLICLGIILNPYLYLAATGPNKEMAMTLVTLYIARCIVFKPKYGLLKAILVALATFFIRDGYSLILLAAIALFYTRLPAKILWRIGIALAFLGAIASEVLLSSLSVIARQTSLSDENKQSAIVGGALTSSAGPALAPVKQVIRMLYNWLTLSTFPALSTQEGDIYGLGWAYWIYGILIAMSIFACLYVVFIKTDNQNAAANARLKISALVIFLWSMVSVLSFVQPRYLIPILPLAFGVLISVGKTRRLLFGGAFICFSVFVITTYRLLGTVPPKAQAEDLVPNTASFLINPREK